MKESCISNPAKEPLIIIRTWQVEFCKGNQCAAALISFFNYWHDIKLDIKERNVRENKMMERHGESGYKLSTDLHQFHTEEDLEEGIMNLWKKDKIRTSLKELEELGILEITKNPNPKYAFDKTRYFLLHPEVANEYIERRKNNYPKTENQSRYTENPSPSLEKQSTITETTSVETTSKDDIIFSLPNLNSLETDASVREAFENSEEWLKKGRHIGLVESKEHEIPMLCINLPNYRPIHVVSNASIGILSHKQIGSLISPLNRFENHEVFHGYFRRLDDQWLILGNKISDDLGMGETKQPTEEQKEHFNL